MAYSNNAKIELFRESKQLEQDLQPVTEELNYSVLSVNKATWLKNLHLAEGDMLRTVSRARELAKDEDFRPNSPADCTRVLFSGTGVVPKLSKKTKQASTDKDTLEDLAHKGNELAGAILEARSAISIHSQLNAWEAYALAGRVQPTWNQEGTPHGRYTSEKPCINNRIVPIRETIEAPAGYSFLSTDLGQAEYVTWASLSGDKILGDAFEHGEDFHTAMADGISYLVPEWKPADLRAAGKTINFAILYQMTAFALARKLGTDQGTAQKIIDAYYNRATQASAYVKATLVGASTTGWVETYYGRRRYCQELTGELDKWKLHETEKTVWHHHNAGTAAELVKIKQLRTWNRLRKLGFGKAGVRLAIQMYDELIWQVADSILEPVQEIAEQEWRAIEPGFLPFPMTVKVGKNWREVSK